MTLHLIYRMIYSGPIARNYPYEDPFMSFLIVYLLVKREFWMEGVSEVT